MAWLNGYIFLESIVVEIAFSAKRYYNYCRHNKFMHCGKSVKFV